MTELDKYAGYNLWRACNVWLRMARKTLEPFGITHAQFFALGAVDFLSQYQERVTQADIARFADFDENTASQVVRSLAERGLLCRSPHPEDHRAQLLSLTPDGQQAVVDARAAFKPATARFFAPLGDDLDQFVATLRLLTETAEATCREAARRRD